MELIELIRTNKYNTDKYSPHTYIQNFYSKEFAKYKNKKNFSILEIGILDGGSLNLWRDYFKGEIVGIDVFARTSHKSVKNNIQENITTHKVDSFNTENKFGFDAIQSRKDFFNLYNETGFDIIIDDGHHDGTSQVTTFNNFKHLIKSGGLYVIEDIKSDYPHYQIIKEANIPNLEILNLTQNNSSDNILGIIKFP